MTTMKTKIGAIVEEGNEDCVGKYEVLAYVKWNESLMEFSKDPLKT